MQRFPPLLLLLRIAVLATPARAVVQDTDRYGRTVGRVYVGNVDVNAEMVKQGAAGVYRKYPKDQGLARPVGACRRRRAHPPWEWRQAGRAGGLPGGSSRAAAPATSATGFTGGSNRYCSEMASGEEAKFYLRQCGVRSLASNSDGVPGELLGK